MAVSTFLLPLNVGRTRLLRDASDHQARHEAGADVLAMAPSEAGSGQPAPPPAPPTRSLGRPYASSEMPARFCRRRSMNRASEISIVWRRPRRVVPKATLKRVRTATTQTAKKITGAIKDAK